MLISYQQPEKRWHFASNTAPFAYLPLAQCTKPLNYFLANTRGINMYDVHATAYAFAVAIGKVPFKPGVNVNSK